MKIKEEFVLEEVGESYIAVAVGDGADAFPGMVRMNGTGAFLWNLIKDKDMTREEILAEMLKVYDVEPDVALSGIDAFIKQLADAGIVE